MNNNLEQLARKTMADIWRQSDGLLDSKDVYQQLKESDVDIQENALNNFFMKLEKEGVIRIATKFHNRDEAKKHGAIVINWISPSLLDTFE